MKDIGLLPSMWTEATSFPIAHGGADTLLRSVNVMCVICLIKMDRWFGSFGNGCFVTCNTCPNKPHFVTSGSCSRWWNFFRRIFFQIEIFTLWRFVDINKTWKDFQETFGKYFYRYSFFYGRRIMEVFLGLICSKSFALNINYLLSLSRFEFCFRIFSI